MSAGVAHVMVGVFYSSVAADECAAVEFGGRRIVVNVTDNVCAIPAPRMVPAAGQYANVPGTLAVAVNCVALRAVPVVMSAGFAHVMTGVALSTVSDTVAVVVA